MMARRVEETTIQTFVTHFPCSLENPAVFVSSRVSAVHERRKIIVAVHAIKPFARVVLGHLI